MLKRGILFAHAAVGISAALVTYIFMIGQSSVIYTHQLHKRSHWAKKHRGDDTNTI